MGSRAAGAPRRIGGALAVVALAANLVVGAAPAYADTPTADFDWSMPERTGLDEDADGVADVIPADEIVREEFRVDLDACASTGSPAKYRWTIDGAPEGQTPACTTYVHLPEGVHEVLLETLDGDGSILASTTRDVTVQDWLIVAIGDSYGSGEGNPDIAGDLFAGERPQWQNRRCHRSALSGQARAAEKLEEADPRTSVTLVQLSCSGAEVWIGLLGEYAGPEPPDGAPDLPPQLDRVQELIGDREIDALVVSIGGNDANFGDVVMSCMATEPCHTVQAQWLGVNVLSLACAAVEAANHDVATACWNLFDTVEPDPRADELFAQGLAGLAGGYGDLEDGLAERFPLLTDEPGRVYITEYPNATEDDDGSICKLDLFDPLASLPGWSADEGEWVRGTMTPDLNALIETTADGAGWTYVGGIFDAFATHGYCASDGWFRRLQDSLVTQWNEKGAVHPTRDGHTVYRDAIYAALLTDLYASGDFAAPRPPLDTAPPVVTGVPDRVPNDAGWYSADVTIDWQATDPQPSSGAPTDPANTVASTEGAAVVYTSGESCDPAGNCATGSLALSIDKTAPVIARSLGADSCSVPGNSGWCRGTQTAGFTAGDALSGVSSPCTGASCSFTRQTATEGAAVTIQSGPASDVAGNVTPGIDGGPFKVDATPPTLACPATAPVFTLRATDAPVLAAVSDALSGPEAAEVTGPADTSSVGAKSLLLTGRDVAGNSTTISCPYVVAYVFDGFSSPVDNDGVINVARAGRAIPLRWRLTDASGLPVTDLATAAISARSLACAAGTSQDLIEETTAGGSSLQNLGDGYYQLGWKSPTSYGGSCKTLHLDLGEGITRTALFSFRR